MTADREDLSVAELQVLIDALPTAPQLTSLRLCLQSNVGWQLNLAPLAQLRLLTALHWNHNRGAFSQPQLAVIMELPLLRKLNYQGRNWNEGELGELPCCTCSTF